MCPSYSDCKVLATSSVPTKITVPVVEHSLTLKPLTLRSSLRLFARLSQALPTMQRKADFVRALVPPTQADVTVHADRQLNPTGWEILRLFGKGYPPMIIKIACSSDHDEVNLLLQQGVEAIRLHGRSGRSRSRLGATSVDANPPRRDQHQHQYQQHQQHQHQPLHRAGSNHSSGSAGSGLSAGAGDLNDGPPGELYIADSA